MKKFNTTGTCVPEEDYMVDISGRATQIKKLVDNRLYLVIEKPPKLGKTTMLAALERVLTDSGYTVISINFGHLDGDCFKWEEIFCVGFIKQAVNALQFAVCDRDYIKHWADYNISDIDSLGRHIGRMCKGKKVVLIIDGADKNRDSHIFLRFLNMLRTRYIASEIIGRDAFHSVILAGVNGIKSIKIPENVSAHTPKTYNTMSNITAEYSGNMLFTPAETAAMLKEYKEDNIVDMDIAAISQAIHDYTGGHPYLMSKLCKCIDEDLERDWTADGLLTAVKLLLGEKNTMLASIICAVENDAYLYELVYDILITGEYRKYEPDVDFISAGERIGLIKQTDGDIISRIATELNITSNGMCLANRIYEMLFCNYFISQMDITPVPKDININCGGKFSMERCLERFAEYYAETSAGRNTEYLERSSRVMFLAYLKEYMSIYGLCYIDSGNTNMCRMDITAEIGGEQYIIELRTQSGRSQYKDDIYQEFADYLESRGKMKGYLAVFDFRHDADEERRAEYIEIDGKTILEVAV
ncbi:MAG: ATP-binding protein [Oscillospiraceae bacterium]|nr:ATP-binding protein [Oscillospiraceae bacterium]